MIQLDFFTIQVILHKKALQPKCCIVQKCCSDRPFNDLATQDKKQVLLLNGAESISVKVNGDDKYGSGLTCTFIPSDNRIHLSDQIELSS